MSSTTPDADANADAPIDTRTRLLQAAAAEFIEHGFNGTDTNRIARRAGFAPQTFYRWYKDKLDVYVRVYEAWEEAENQLLEALLTSGSASRRIAEELAEGHRSFLLFRRNLRQLAADNEQVRTARAQSRLRQVAALRGWLPGTPHSDQELAALLVAIERLGEALAEGEFDAMGMPPDAALQLLADLLDRLRG